MNQDRWATRFARSRKLGLLTLLGLPIIVPGILTNMAILVGRVLLALPGLAYLHVLTILHWKERYRGHHSDLWGVLILIEASGWFKIVYLFRHLIPDARHSGRYSAAESNAEI